MSLTTGEPVIESDREVFFYLGEKDFNWDPENQNYELLKGKNIGAINGANYGPKFMKAEKDKIVNVERDSINEPISPITLDVNMITIKESELKKLYPDL